MVPVRPGIHDREGLPGIVLAAIEPTMHFSLDSPAKGQWPQVAGSARIALQGRAEARQGALTGGSRENLGVRRDRRSLALPGGSEIGV